MARKPKEAERPPEPVRAQEETRYPAAGLLNSKSLSGYQRDFAKVLLGEGEYTIREAKAILDNYFKGGKANGGR
jgi:hypothetical protein